MTSNTARTGKKKEHRRRRAHAGTRPAPLAKLTPPRLHAAYPRERLFEILDACRAKPLVWIAAPPGAGKTTLAATWLAYRRIPGIWYQLDPGDSDPATFFFYLRRAAEAVGAGRPPLPLLTQEYLGDVTGFSRRWFREAFTRLPAGAVLVLDNYQDVAAESALHRALAAACEELTRSAQILVISWAEPPPEFARFRADERLAQIDVGALDLTLEEARGIVAGKEALTLEQIRELHALCDGWAAGFTLLRDRLRRTGLVNRIDHRGNMQDVFDYFMAQAFREATPETREALVRTALFPRFTDAMAAEISGDPRIDELLDRLYRRHLFLDRRYGAEVTYQYHTLFRAFLLDEARRRYTPLGVAELSHRAAAILEHAGQPEEALELLLASGGAGRAALLVEKLAPGLVATGRGAALEKWIEKLPDAELDRHPWLSYWRGAGLAGTDLQRARSAFEVAYGAFVRGGDRVGQALSLVGVLNTYLMGWEARSRLEQWLRDVDEVFREEPTMASNELAAGVYASLVRLMLYYAPEHPLYPVFVTRLESLVRGELTADLKVSAGGQLVELYAFAGLVRNAERLVAELEPLAARPDVTPYSRASWWLNTHRVDVVLGDFDSARRKLDTALAIATENAFHPLLKMIFAYKADVALALHDIDEARGFTERTRAALQGKSQARIHWQLAKIAAVRGDLDEALREGEESCAYADLTRVSLGRDAYYTELTSILLERREFARARSTLERWDCLFPADAFPYIAFRRQSLSALLDAATACESDWRTQLRMAFTRVREPGIIVPLSTHTIVARQVAECALAEDIETTYVRTWVRKARLRPSSPDVPNWPWPLQIRTLGAFAVAVDDVPLAFRGRVQRKPLELLQALVAFGARGVPTEALIDALWPDSEADAAESALRMALARLRRLLGRPDAVVLRDAKLSLDDGSCWTDAAALERICHAVDVAPKQEHAARLLEVYRGAFLAREREHGWVLAARDHLRQRFARAVDVLARWLIEQHRPGDAVAFCRQALARDQQAPALASVVAAAERAA